MENLETLIAIAGFCLGLLTAGGGALAAFIQSNSGRALKAYAAQRDFEHLKRHYESLAEAFASLDRRFDRLDFYIREGKNSDERKEN